MHIHIEPLSAAYLERTCSLIDKCFADEPMHPDLPARESMDKTKHLRRSLLDAYGEEIDSIDYWIAIDDDDDQVVGTSGLYENVHDEQEASWMEYYCVDPAYRGHHIGGILIQKAIDEARKRGKKYLRLYTNDVGSPTVAQQIYVKLGFRLTKREWDQHRGLFLLFMEMAL